RQRDHDQPAVDVERHQPLPKEIALLGVARGGLRRGGLLAVRRRGRFDLHGGLTHGSGFTLDYFIGHGTLSQETVHGGPGSRSGRRDVEIDRGVHRVQAEVPAVADDYAARLILRDWLQRVARVFLPVDQVRRGGDGGAPAPRVRPGLRGPVVVGVIAALVLGNLIEGDQVPVVGARAGR